MWKFNKYNGEGVCVVIYGYFFFFSSRRRHTRLVSDWSSDVCSSDLVVDAFLAAEFEGGRHGVRVDLIKGIEG